MELIRVRNLLSNMDADARASMKKLLPKTTFPDVETKRYPSAILSALPKDQSYSLLGFIAEEMLRATVADITTTTLETAIKKWFPEVTPAQITKINKSKTTMPFLESIKKTRQQMDARIKGTLIFDTAVTYGQVEGHPDAQTETQIFEVKLTGQLKKNWVQFLYQVFAYAALESKATEVFLVLPLQELVWAFNLANWPNKARTQLRDLLNTTSVNRQTVKDETAPEVFDRLQVQMSYNIGNHMHKDKSLVKTIQNLATFPCPVQIFLGSTIGAKLHIADAELAESAKELAKTSLRIFVHSPYIINLCADKGEQNDFAVNLLKKNLQYAAIVGFKGVVVHVGKSVKKDKATAIENMRRNLLEAAEAATPDCPILLETPAGQGTELLTTYEEFVPFVQQFNDPKIRICIDTCHVFASGLQPLEYLKRVTAEYPTLTKLVHYNDSSAACGSCLDRHAAFGTGKIGLKTMIEIAEHCKTHSYPMVIE
jgi:deoxyribonuclease-4